MQVTLKDTHYTFHHITVIYVLIQWLKLILEYFFHFALYMEVYFRHCMGGKMTSISQTLGFGFVDSFNMPSTWQGLLMKINPSGYLQD